jgi:hypothetical protein
MLAMAIAGSVVPDANLPAERDTICCMSQFSYTGTMHRFAFSISGTLLASALLCTTLVFTPAAVRAQSTTTPAAQPPDPTLPPVQEPEAKHARKYKAPPVTSHIEVFVTGGLKSKPVPNAMVIFHPLSATGKDEGAYEVKADDDGKAVIDVIPQGTNVVLQVIAPYPHPGNWPYSPYGANYAIKDLNQTIKVQLERIRSQYSTYTNDNNHEDKTKPGVIEPAKPVVPKPPPTAGALSGSAAANSNANRDLTGITTPNTTTTPSNSTSTPPTTPATIQSGTQTDTTPTTPVNPAQPQQTK